tara:strand:+ start:574 stop:849 length:276 start_codon:yes stop_codon:yes gene_type:complete
MANPKTLSFPMNKAEYISALYNTLAAIGYAAAVKGQYSLVIPLSVEQKMMGLRKVMDWVSDAGITIDRIAIDEEGDVTILPIPPTPEESHV